MKGSFDRRKCRAVYVGGAGIGADNPISIQSMTNTDTHDIEATYTQVMRLWEAGCDIVRITAPDLQSVKTFEALISRGVKIPLVADIHFNYEIAIAAAESGISKIRINPGNIGSDENVRRVVEACKKSSVPIRIGVNSGSLEKHILAKQGSPTPEALVESAMYHAELLERFDFDDIVISIKSSHVAEMKKASEIVASKCNYPLHIGVTESGRGESGLIKSAAGIGSLLLSGIGDTLRISLTDNPVNEVYYAKKLLRALELTDEHYINIISCPTCGRTKIDLIKICEEIEKRLPELPEPSRNLTVAVMGCVVNGPGEASDADLGIAGGKDKAVIFKNGQIYKTVDILDSKQEFIKEIKNCLQ
jgi:(E)-4-hydroxy-3-methylbut-2-enyl-diphosphate synthase